MLRFVVALLAVSLLCRPAVAAAGKRTWTDRSGRQISAKFVRVHEGDVVLLRGGRVVKLPFSTLSDGDRKYVTEQLEDEGKPRSARSGAKKGLTPVEPGPAGDESADDRPADDGPADDGPAEELGTPTASVDEYRTWTDARARQVVAKFVRVTEGNIVLLKDGKEVSFPFVNFSKQDQRHVASLLRSRGQEYLIPASANLGEGMGDGAEGPRGMGRFDAGGPGSMPGRPGYMGHPSGGGARPQPRFGPAAGMEGMDEMDGMSGMEEFSSDTEPMPGMDESAGHVPGPHNSFPGGNHFSGGPQDNGPGPGMGSGPVVEEFLYHYCESCKHVLPEDFKAGQRCPGCRRKISFIENTDGTYTTQSGKRVSKIPGGRYTTGVSIVIAAIAFIAFLIRVASRM